MGDSDAPVQAAFVGAGLCTLQISVAIGDMERMRSVALNQAGRPNFTNTWSREPLPWIVKVGWIVTDPNDPTFKEMVYNYVWRSGDNDKLTVNKAGIAMGHASISVGHLLKTLRDLGFNLDQIVDWAEAKVLPPDGADLYRAWKIDVGFADDQGHEVWHEFAIDMGLGGHP